MRGGHVPHRHAYAMVLMMLPGAVGHRGRLSLGGPARARCRRSRALRALPGTSGPVPVVGEWSAKSPAFWLSRHGMRLGFPPHHASRQSRFRVRRILRQPRPDARPPCTRRSPRSHRVSRPLQRISHAPRSKTRAVHCRPHERRYTARAGTQPIGWHYRAQLSQLQLRSWSLPARPCSSPSCPRPRPRSRSRSRSVLRSRSCQRCRSNSRSRS